MNPKVSNSALPAAPRIVLGVLVLVSIVLMTVFAREGDDGALHAIQDGVQSLIVPVGSIGAAADAAVDGAGEGLANVTADEASLSALREQNESLRAMVAQSEEYRQEAERLQELLNLTDRYDVSGVSAHVVGRSTDAWNQTITIDVGSDAGVETGMTVMAATGVIGQVASVNPTNAQVRLLSDAQSGAAALLQSSRAEGIVRGSLDGLLYLENIGADTDVQVGDVVLTSGLGGSYVSGLLIGTVARVEGNAGDAARRILVTPNTTASSMEEVTVVFKADASASTSDKTTRRDSADDGASTDAGDEAQATSSSQSSGGGQ